MIFVGTVNLEGYYEQVYGKAKRDKIAVQIDFTNRNSRLMMGVNPIRCTMKGNYRKATLRQYYTKIQHEYPSTGYTQKH